MTDKALDHSLSDILVAMDAVDALRREENLINRAGSRLERESRFKSRLREIYQQQGIAVTEELLEEAVAQLEAQHLVYAPPKPSFSVWLAKIYVRRDRWLRPALLALLLMVALSAFWFFGRVLPQRSMEARAHIELTETLPAKLDGLAQSIREVAKTSEIEDQLKALLDHAKLARSAGDLQSLRNVTSQIGHLQARLAQSYEIRVVYRPGETSGFFTVPDAAPDQRNYYLVVEAVDPTGKILTLPIESEEDQSIAPAKLWAKRVEKSVYDRIAADKRDDQIIQNAVIGQKNQVFCARTII